jgi:hypothetical protein
MASHDVAERPDLREVIGGLLQRVAPDQQPLLIAIAERMAAERYRRWAEEFPDATRKVELLACADREEEIASRVEALYPNAATIQRELEGKHPDLEEINRTLFADRPIAEQMEMQAEGERLGAATWRAFAEREGDASRSGVLLSCAGLEEESAAVLEAIVRGS